jgi:hypothetical protein
VATPTGSPRRAFGDTVDASRDWMPARQEREKDEHGGVSVAERTADLVAGGNFTPARVNGRAASNPRWSGRWSARMGFDRPHGVSLWLV